MLLSLHHWVVLMIHLYTCQLSLHPLVSRSLSLSTVNHWGSVAWQTQLTDCTSTLASVEHHATL